MLTGTNGQGKLYGPMATCKDWTSATGAASEGKPRVGHSWPRTGTDQGGPGPDGGSIAPAPLDGGFAPAQPDGGFAPPDSEGGAGDYMGNWMSSLDEAGCAPGIYLLDTGPAAPGTNTVGSAGGCGGFYCFALSPWSLED